MKGSKKSLKMEGPDTKKVGSAVPKKTEVIPGGKKFAGKMFDGPDLSGGGHVK